MLKWFHGACSRDAPGAQGAKNVIGPKRAVRPPENEALFMED